MVQRPGAADRADFPAVAARRIDSEAKRGSRWHAIARQLVAEHRIIGVSVGPTIELQDLGSPAIIIDGVVHRPRLTKAYELLAFLLTCRDRRADRLRLLDALFDGRADDSARSYLRRAIREIRDIAPEALTVDDRFVGLSHATTTSTTSERAEALLLEAGRLHGTTQLERTRIALEVLSAGEYLPGASSAWAEVRREHLRTMGAEARMRAAQLAFEHGRFAEVDDLLTELLQQDPWRESAWRLRIRLADALGDDDGVLDAYQRCCTALGVLNMTPSTATRDLVAEIRRSSLGAALE